LTRKKYVKINNNIVSCFFQKAVKERKVSVYSNHMNVISMSVMRDLKKVSHHASEAHELPRCLQNEMMFFSADAVIK